MRRGYKKNSIFFSTFATDESFTNRIISDDLQQEKYPKCDCGSITEAPGLKQLLNYSDPAWKKNVLLPESFTCLSGMRSILS